MAWERIAMTQDNMAAGTAGLREVAAQSASFAGGIKGKFASILDAGFLTGTLDSIAKGSSSIGSCLETINNTINSKVSDMFEIDRKGAEMFESMEICKDFYVNNDTDTNEYKNVLLERIGSKSVNEGENKDSRTGNDETTIKEIMLKDIRGQEGKVYDEQHSNVENIAIGNINIAENKGVQVESESSVINQALGNINKGEVGGTRESDNVEVVDANISNVNKGPVMTSNTGREAEYNIPVVKNDGPEIVEVGNKEKAPVAPLATSAAKGYEANIGEEKKNTIGAGITAGLAGLAGLAGVAGMAMASREKEDEEEEKEKEENKQ